MVEQLKVKALNSSPSTAKKKKKKKRKRSSTPVYYSKPALFGDLLQWF
jgi:hypothetical protein